MNVEQRWLHSSSLVLNASSPTSPGPASAYFDGTSFFETEGFFS